MAGEDVFLLYDTFGFPVDLTEDIAGKKGIGLDMDGFNAQMEIQREKARGSSSFGAVFGESGSFNSGRGQGLGEVRRV